MKRHAMAASALALALLAGGAASAAEAPAPKGKMVFVVMRGLDDLQTLNASLRHAAVAKKSGHVQDVVWLAYGRGVQALDGDASARPPQTAEYAREAQAAGVRLVVCERALGNMGIPRGSLDPKPDELVPSGVVRLAELVSQGYEVLTY